MNWLDCFNNLDPFYKDNEFNESVNHHFAFIACSDDLDWYRKHLEKFGNVYFHLGRSAIELFHSHARHSRVLGSLFERL
ncbi:unnamed protein product [Gordionus sp. m RMFG-2023]